MMTDCARCGCQLHTDENGVLIDNSGGDVCGVLGGNEPHLDVEQAITISLEIENRYELYDDETTYRTDEVIPAPPTLDDDSDEYRDWADEHVFQFTGVGHEDGDSWYDVTVTACSEPALVGRTFEFGY